MGFQKGHKAFGTKESYIARGKKISRSLKGRIISEASRLKMRLAKLGKKQSPETIAKRIRRGHTLTEEHKRKIGMANRAVMISKGCRPDLDYSDDWTMTLKRAIRERDNYVCQRCNALQGDRAFDVHHKDCNKHNNSPDNLITLCVSCHRRIHNAIINKAKQR